MKRRLRQQQRTQGKLGVMWTNFLNGLEVFFVCLNCAFFLTNKTWRGEINKPQMLCAFRKRGSNLAHASLGIKEERPDRFDNGKSASMATSSDPRHQQIFSCQLDLAIEWALFFKAGARRFASKATVEFAAGQAWPRILRRPARTRS